MVNAFVEPIARPARWKRFFSGSYLRLSLCALIALLFVGQVATGTSPVFATLVSTFIIIGYWTIHVLGGIGTLGGASVFVFMHQHVIICQASKVFYGAPADTPLLRPLETMLAYNLGITSICLAAYAFRALRVDRIKPIFKPIEDTAVLGVMTAVFSTIAIARFFILQRFGVYEGVGGGVYVGGFVGPLRQFGFVGPLAIACGTGCVLIKSESKRCLGFWNTTVILATTMFGILGAGRQDSASSVVTFMVTLLAFRFRLRFIHVAFGAIAFYVFQFILFPYALYARGEGQVREGTFDERIQKAAAVLVDVAFHQEKYQEKEKVIDPNAPWAVRRMYYYGRPLPTLDRYTVLISTDNIVNAVLQKGPAGWENAVAGFSQLLPRVINTEKSALGSSNALAHYGDGLVGEGDIGTQITLGLVPEGFYSARWFGIFLLCFGASLGYFIAYRCLFAQSMSRNVYLVAQVFVATWVFSESTMQSQTLLILQTPVYYVALVLPILIFAKTLTRRRREADFVYIHHDDPAADSPAIAGGSASPVP